MKKFILILLLLTSNIYSETINGHTLPPEPDPIINNSTLLGIDSNKNGVRDDVERKVYATYQKAIQRVVMMQAFRVEQEMLADPDMVDNARAWRKKIAKSLNCRRYLYLYKGQPRIKKMATITDEWQYNNEERVQKYIDYNKALSGGVYSLGNPKAEDCEFDVDKVLEMDELSTPTQLPETINGHTLPPEPDPIINNSTLLGIDSNNNCVRDDVERWIYKTYKDKHPIHIDIAMQAARAYKKVLETPERAKEIHDEVNAPLDCQFYYMYDAKYENKPLLIKEDILSKYFRKKIYFNTKERMDAYIKYDTLLSGDSYSLPSFEEEKKACDFNTSKYEE